MPATVALIKPPCRINRAFVDGTLLYYDKLTQAEVDAMGLQALVQQRAPGVSVRRLRCGRANAVINANIVELRDEKFDAFMQKAVLPSKDDEIRFTVDLVNWRTKLSPAALDVARKFDAGAMPEFDFLSNMRYIHPDDRGRVVAGIMRAIDEKSGWRHTSRCGGITATTWATVETAGGRAVSASGGIRPLTNAEL